MLTMEKETNSPRTAEPMTPKLPVILSELRVTRAEDGRYRAAWAGNECVVRVGTSPPAEGVRLLQIDWSAPTLDAFRFGTYAPGVPVTLVTTGQPAGLARDFLAFARAAEGSELLGRSVLVSR